MQKCTQLHSSHATGTEMQHFGAPATLQLSSSTVLAGCSTLSDVPAVLLLLLPPPTPIMMGAPADWLGFPNLVSV
jgi:hypothetical protein